MSDRNRRRFNSLQPEAIIPLRRGMSKSGYFTYALRVLAVGWAVVISTSCNLHGLAVNPDSGLHRADKPTEEVEIRVRVARPTDKLEEVIAFYRDALGLPIIGNFDNHAGYSGVMFGAPSERFHLEFTHKDGSPGSSPTKDNLLVFYYQDQLSYDSAINRMLEHGSRPVAPENPYWDERSLTFEDPDGWRVVLYHGVPFGGS